MSGHTLEEKADKKSQNQDAHYAIFKSIANFHGLHKHLYDVSQQDQLGAQGSLAGMAEKFAWARKMDNWRDGTFIRVLCMLFD